MEGEHDTSTCVSSKKTEVKIQVTEAAGALKRTYHVNKYTKRRHKGWTFVLLFGQVPLLIRIITPEHTNEYKANANKAI